MEFSGSSRLRANRAIVWEALNDPAVLQACIPGCERFEPTADGLYDIEVGGRIGPIKALFTGSIRLVELDTAHTPHELLEVCRERERDAERVRTIRWGPRTLDVDVLWVDGETVDDPPELLVPHPRMFERAFVLVPLADLAPGTYSVLVTAADGCVGEGAVEVDEPDPVQADPYLEPPSCPGLEDGVVGAVASGGTPDYNTTWTLPGGGTASGTFLTGVSAGTYAFSVDDANGCTTTGTAV